MLRLEDLGPLAYGTVVTLANAWDTKRIDEGKITKKEVFKKMETWAYVVPGAAAILSSAMGWMPRQEVWIDKVSTGFIYDAPRFIKGVVESMRAENATSSRAVREAQEILRHNAARQLAAGKSTERSYAPNWEKVGAY